MTSTPEFIRRATDKFGDRFDYSGVMYSAAKGLVSIKCPEHGVFLQSPQDHLRSKHGCPSCGERGKRTKRSHSPAKSHTSPENYLSRLSLPDGYRIDMSRYVGITQGVVGVFCPIHGLTWEPPRSILIRSYPCAQCGRRKAHPRTKSFEDFVREARSIYGDRYEYQGSEYLDRKSTLGINCRAHGVFFKTAQKHLSGQGCPVCKHVEGVLDGKFPGGYSERFFREHPEVVDTPATLYYARVGRRYKIGITARDVNRRLASIQSRSKQLTTLVKSWSLPLREAYREEQRILAFHSKNRIARRWSTEVFDSDVLRLDT